jgi:predicted extracellular nuclease
MRSWIALGTSAASVLCALACDRAERETLDRVDDHDESTWTSRSDCEALLPPQQTRGATPRIGTWNVRYFPDSQEGAQTDPEAATDVPWLACAIASLDVDVLAIQEFKNTDLAAQKKQELVQRLNELTGGDWRIEVAACQPAEVQHPGFLYDASRVTGSHFREISLLNPDPVCSNVSSPGFGGYFSVQGGPDFHLISVHLTAGDAVDSIEKRDYSVSVLPSVAAEARALVADDDLIFTGDFNTSGCVDCAPAVSSAEEVAQVAETVSAMGTPFRLLQATESCSRQIDDNPPLVDHFVATSSMAEVPAQAVAHVTGICEEIHCDRLRNWLEDARERLSDHCPVLLELAPDAD